MVGPSLWRRNTLASLLCFIIATLTRAQDGVLTLEVEDSLPPIPENILVGAYYYPWHGDDFHRGGGYLRKELDPRQYPTLGEYDDTRPEVIAQHLAWSRQANINLWVCSWWGPGSREDVTISKHILPNSDLGQHKIALFYETSSRVQRSENFSVRRVAPDMEHICKTFFDHDNYHKIDEKPVIFMYLTRVLSTVPGKLQEVTTIMRRTARETCSTEIYIVGDQVFGRAPSSAYDPFLWLDAVTNYDVYGNTNNPPFAGQAVVDSYYADQKAWRTSANRVRKGYIPSVSPGYNDRGVRLGVNHIGLSRRLTEDSEPGSLFVAQLQQARYLVDDMADRVLMVNSFNEFHEDTQIEPVVGETASEPLLYTNGIRYEGYGELYLNILRATTCDSNCRPFVEWRTLALQKDPFDGLPPDDILLGAYYTALGRNTLERQQFLRKTLNQLPELGLYDGFDRVVVAKHFEYSRAANIGLWVIPIWRPGDNADHLVREVVLPHPEIGNIKVSLYYNVRNRFNEDDPVTSYDLLRQDIEYMCRNFFGHTNYYKVVGRPVLFLGLTRVLSNKGVLLDVVADIRATASANGYDIYVVGDQVWQSAPTDEVYLPFLELDAVTNTDIKGNIGNIQSEGVLKQGAIDEYYNDQRDWRDRAWKSNSGFIPTVLPGYNNRPFQPQRTDAVMARYLEGQATDSASLLRHSIMKARYLVDSELQNLVLVNSFNNFLEDTQIEPVLGAPTSAPNAATAGLSYESYGSSLLDVLQEGTKNNIVDVRSTPVQSFHPLTCNVISNVETASCDLTWSELFGGNDTHAGEILIPCGTCVTLDILSPSLDLQGGIDIQGKLVIPDGYNIHIKATYVRVQGILDIVSTKLIDGNPDVQFTLVEGDPGAEKFVPATNNGYACGVQRCDPGPQSIVVAGGRLNIQAIAPDTPTWVHLRDVIPDDDAPPNVKAQHCPVDGIVIDEPSFAPDTTLFSKTLGSKLAFDGGIMSITNRNSAAYHGAQIDLSGQSDCFLVDETYVLTASVRVNHERGGDDFTQCASSGTSCFQVVMDHMDSNQSIQSSVKYQGPAFAKFKYGDWMTVQTEIQFSAAEVNPANLFLVLRLTGGEENSALEVRSFLLERSINEVCSAEVPNCHNLLSCNGNAEHGISSSQFQMRGDVSLRVEYDKDEKNHFWRIDRSEASSSESGISWRVAPDCIVRHAVYEFSMRIRVHVDTAGKRVAAGVYLEVDTQTDSYKRQVNCPESEGQWVLCQGYFVVDDLMSQDIKKATMFVETAGTTFNYDVDNLTMKFVHMEGPVSRIVVDESIKQKWGIGSRILITSHSLAWHQQTERRITGFDAHYDGSVVLTIDQPIPRVSSSVGNDFPVEVALLSRNVLITSDENSPSEATAGAHLTIFYTPDVVQIIKGVEFSGCGRPGAQEQFASGSVKGSVVSKNTITNSNHGCIVISSTNEVVVENNIAFGTRGSCFVVRDGFGNIVRKNVGAKTMQYTNLGDTQENEDVVATFLLASAQNQFYGNAAAGSQGDGVVLLLQTENDASNAYLSTFHDNMAHSNYHRGFHILTETLYSSQSKDMILKGLSSYRNKGTGVAVSSSQNVVLEDLKLSDNRVGLDIYRSAGVTINRSTISGMSADIRRLEATQHGLPAKLCLNRQTQLVGIKIDSAIHSGQNNGLLVKNSEFFGFEDVEICEEYAFATSPESGLGAFSFHTTLSNLTIEDSAPSFNLCPSFKNDMEDVFIVDNGSSLRRGEGSKQVDSCIVSQGSPVLSFIPDDKKTHDEALCQFYCEATCLRNVVFSVDPTVSQDWKLRICTREEASTCATYDSIPYLGELGQPITLFATEGTYFSVTLPRGRYTATLLDDGGSRSWPTHVETIFLNPLCDNSLQENTLWLPIPPIDNGSCNRLVRNGDAEASLSQTTNWISGAGGLSIESTAGRKGSPAFCDVPSRLSIGSRTPYSLGQYLDTRCLVEGREYSIEAWVRPIPLVDGNVVDSSSQSSVPLCSEDTMCPEMGIVFTSNDGYSWITYFEDSANSGSNDNVFIHVKQQPRGRDLTREQEASGRKLSSDDDGYYRLEGTFLVDAEAASASSAFFFIDRDDLDRNVKFCVDDVKITRVTVSDNSF